MLHKGPFPNYAKSNLPFAPHTQTCAAELKIKFGGFEILRYLATKDTPGQNLYPSLVPVPNVLTIRVLLNLLRPRIYIISIVCNELLM
jgi:hypothetical protein